MSTLLELTDEMLNIYTMMQQEDCNYDELGDHIKQLFTDKRGDIKEKVDNYCALITEMKMRGYMRQQEADRLAAKAKTDTNAAKRLADILQYVFGLLELKKLNTARYTVGVQKNGGSVPVIVPEDPSVLPEDFQKVTVAADKSAIREALKEGKSVPGCSFGEQVESIRIR